MTLLAGPRAVEAHGSLDCLHKRQPHSYDKADFNPPPDMENALSISAREEHIGSGFPPGPVQSWKQVPKLSFILELCYSRH